MKALIIEDEKPAAEKLQKALAACQAPVEVMGIVATIKEAVAFLQQPSHPELIFMDIELSDGLSLRIFEQVQVNCPVIFITAYDEYWQEAFEHNSIDYLLKPVRQEKLEASLRKFEKLKQYFAASYSSLAAWQPQSPVNGYKKRFLAKRGSDYVSVRTEDIAYFYATHKLVCMVDGTAQKFILDQSLSDIEAQVDPSLFYRANRKFLVNMSAIRRITSYPKSKLLIEVEPVVSEEIIISQENVAAFKQWMDQ